MRRKLLFSVALLVFAAIGGWIGWLTYAPSPRLDLRAEDDLHPCFFSDDGTELVTEFISRKGDDVQRGFIAWDTATGREKERWAATELRDAVLTAERFDAKRRACLLRTDEGQQGAQVFQVRPWKAVGSPIRKRPLDRAWICDKLLLTEAHDDLGLRLEGWSIESGERRFGVAGTLLALSPLRDRIAADDLHGSAQFWGLPDGKACGVLPSLPVGENRAPPRNYRQPLLRDWLGIDGKRFLDQSVADAGKTPVARVIDVESGRRLAEWRNLLVIAAAPDLPYVVAVDFAESSSQDWAPLYVCRRDAGGVPAKVRLLAAWRLLTDVAEPASFAKAVLVRTLHGDEPNALHAWLLRLGWLKEATPSEQVLIVNLRTGEEELRFRTALAASRFALSPRGDLLACEAKVDPAAAAPRAGTGEFPSFVQVWDLPAAFPWLRTAAWAATPAAALLALAGAVKLVRRRRNRVAATMGCSIPRADPPTA